MQKGDKKKKAQRLIRKNMAKIIIIIIIKDLISGLVEGENVFFRD